MNYKIHKNYDIDKISFKKPEKISKDTTIFNVKYEQNNFLIQTPKLLISNVPKIYTHNNKNFCNIKLSTYNYSFSNPTQNFVKNIELIDKLVEKNIDYFYEKSNIRKPGNTKLINSYFYNKINTKVNFYFNIQIYENKPFISIFDYKKEKKDFNYIISNSFGYSLLWLQNIWIKSNKIGINWIIVQMKIYYPIMKIDECLIEDEENIEIIKESIVENNSNISSKSTEKIKYKDHPVYEKFFKMKKYKIPIENIQQKMLIENIDINIINKDENDYISNNNLITYINHPVYQKFFKMKKYKVPIENIQQKMLFENLDINIIYNDENDYVSNFENIKSKSFFSDIKNAKLKNLTENINKDIVKTSNINKTQPPSLSDILLCKRSLKKNTDIKLW